MKKKELKKVIENLKGKPLTIENLIKECNKFDKNIITKNISIIPGHRIDQKYGWLTIRCLENKVRVTLNNNGIIQ